MVESLRLGAAPKKAAEGAVRRILKFYPSYVGAVIAVDAQGKHAAAAAGWKFEYAVRGNTTNATEVHNVEPLKHNIAGS